MKKTCHCGDTNNKPVSNECGFINQSKDEMEKKNNSPIKRASIFPLSLLPIFQGSGRLEERSGACRIREATTA